MDYSNIDSKIDQLNLEWREYDFGDTLYVRIPATLLFDSISIYADHKTRKYNIQLQSDGNILIFKESEKVSFVQKIAAIILKLNSTLSKQERNIQSKSKSTEKTDYSTY